MDEEYGNYITIEDEEGNEFELDQLDTLEYEDEEYNLFLPANMEPDDPDYGYIILQTDYDEESGYHVGRCYADSPDIDGLVLFSGDCQEGDMVDVLISSTEDGLLYGEQL